MALHSHPVLTHHLGDLGGRLAGVVEHLAVGESNGRSAIDRGIEIALEVFAPCRRGVVKQAAVEFDDEPLSVFGIAVAHAG